MKKLLRKNQIIITALVVMVAMAGYLSLTDQDEPRMTSTNDSVEDEAVADISDEDIVLDGDGSASGVSVSAIDGGTAVASADGKNAKDGKNTKGAGDGGEDGSSENLASRENAGEAVLVSNTVGGNYFEEAKLSREQTRARNKETLTQLVNNKNATDAQKEKAMNEIMNMTAVSEKETATENLLAAKGFNEAIVTILDDGVDVVVNAEELTEQQIAQIEDVVKRKAECSADKIVISPVGKK